MRFRVLLPLFALSVHACLMGGCTDLRPELQLAQGQVQELLNAKSDLEAKISSLEDEKIGLETKVGELQTSNKQLNSKVSAADRKSEKLEKSLEKFKRDNAECKKNGQKLLEETAMLKSNNEDLARSANELKTKYAQLENQIDLIKKENKDLKKELTELKRALSSSEKKERTKPKPARPSVQDSAEGKGSTSELSKKQELTVSRKAPEPPISPGQKDEARMIKPSTKQQVSGHDKAAKPRRAKQNYSGTEFTKCYRWDGVPVPAFMSEILGKGFHR